MSNRFLVRLYPRAWRHRYGEEFALLLEATPISAGLVINVLASAGRLWLLRTMLGPWVIGAVVAFVAMQVAQGLQVMFPTAPSSHYGVWFAAWPGYIGLGFFLSCAGVILWQGRSVFSGKSAKLSNDAEILLFATAFFVSFAFLYWGSLANGLVSEKPFDTWRSNAVVAAALLSLLMRPNIVSFHESLERR
jgi:hypothetical protein